MTKKQLKNSFVFSAGLLLSQGIKSRSLMISRAWYNGSTSASQAEDEGSIPFARTKNLADLVSVIFLACGVEENPTKRADKINPGVLPGLFFIDRLSFYSSGPSGATAMA